MASLDGENVEVDDNDFALITRNFKRILHKRRFRKGEPNNSFPNQFNNARNKGIQEANKNQANKCYECSQLGHYMSECPIKKKKEGKAEQKSKFNNFQITWNECNSFGDVNEVEESVQMTFMTIGNDEVTTCNSQLNSDNESDDDIESFIERLHDSLKESYTRNKELKQKISFLLQNNVNLFQ